MHINLLFRIAIQNLDYNYFTIFMATFYPVYTFLAIFTYPYEPKPATAILLFGPFINL